MVAPVYVPEGLSEEDLTKYQKRIIYSFYLNPSKVAVYLMRGLKSLDEFKRILRAGRMFVTIAYAGARNL